VRRRILLVTDTRPYGLGGAGIKCSRLAESAEILCASPSVTRILTPSPPEGWLASRFNRGKPGLMCDVCCAFAALLPASYRGTAFMEHQEPFAAQHINAAALDFAAAMRGWRETVFGSDIELRLGAFEGQRLRLNLFMPDGAALREIGFYDTVDNIWTMDVDRLQELARQFRLKSDTKYRILFMVLTPFEWLMKFFGRSAMSQRRGKINGPVYDGGLEDSVLKGNLFLALFYLACVLALLTLAAYMLPFVLALWLARFFFMKAIKAEVTRLVRVGQYLMEAGLLALAKDNSHADASLADERARVAEIETGFHTLFADLIAREADHRCTA
jgi:hypothetical protein